MNSKQHVSTNDAANVLMPAQHHAERILVACIGNIFLGDDGFGVEVAQQLWARQQRFRAGVQVEDFGIRGMDLAYALLDDYDLLILIDTVKRGGSPGTLYLIEPELPVDTTAGDVSNGQAGSIALDTHSMDPVKVLAFARYLGAKPVRTLLIGCEPASFGLSQGELNDVSYEEMHMGLSDPVRAAIDGAIQMLEMVLKRV